MCIKKTFRCFAYCAMICVLCYLILSFSRPDEWMAHYNLKNKEDWIESYDEIRYLFSEDFLLALDRSRYQEILEILFPIVRR